MPTLTLAWDRSGHDRSDLELLLSVIDALTLEPDFERFFSRAANAVRDLVAAEGAALILLTPGGELEYQFFNGVEADRLNCFSGYRFAADAGVTGLALREGRSIFVGDYSSHPQAMRQFAEVGLCADLVIPLQGAGGPLGALALSWFRPLAEPPDPQRIMLAERVAGQIAVACQRHMLEQRLAELANHDTLTGVSNRKRIIETIESRLQKTGNPQPFGVAVIDLDGFKAINDELGHGYGDRVLTDIGARIREICRRSDDVGRIGGDEFVVVTDHCGTLRDVEPLLRRINAALNIAIPFGHRRYRLSASIGVACYPQDGEDIQMLLRRADTAMYLAKTQGGNTYRYYEPRMEEEVRERERLLGEISRGLRLDEFEIYHQPVLRMDTGAVVGSEALLRWNHSERGLTSAGQFMNVVERYGKGMTSQLGRWVLGAAGEQLAAWQAQGLDLSLHVNVSACYFLNKGFVRDLEQMLKSHPGVDAGRLVLELTETALVDDLDHAARAMAACRSLGVRIALDDFGTGYASLTYLRRLPVDIVKIDQSFVAGLLSGSSDNGIVRGILAMAQSLQLGVVAEGVETAELAAELKQLGCVYMQGFALGRPMPVARFDAWMKQLSPGRMSRLK